MTGVDSAVCVRITKYRVSCFHKKSGQGLVVNTANKIVKNDKQGERNVTGGPTCFPPVWLVGWWAGRSPCPGQLFGLGPGGRLHLLFPFVLQCEAMRRCEQ